MTYGAIELLLLLMTATTTVWGFIADQSWVR